MTAYDTAVSLLQPLLTASANTQRAPGQVVVTSGAPGSNEATGWMPSAVAYQIQEVGTFVAQFTPADQQAMASNPNWQALLGQLQAIVQNGDYNLTTQVGSDAYYTYEGNYNADTVVAAATSLIPFVQAMGSGTSGGVVPAGAAPANAGSFVPVPSAVLPPRAVTSQRFSTPTALAALTAPPIPMASGGAAILAPPVSLSASSGAATPSSTGSSPVPSPPPIGLPPGPTPSYPNTGGAPPPPPVDNGNLPTAPILPVATMPIPSPTAPMDAGRLLFLGLLIVGGSLLVVSLLDPDAIPAAEGEPGEEEEPTEFEDEDFDEDADDEEEEEPEEEGIG